MHVTICKRISLTKKKVCIGDLKKRIKVQIRSIVPPEGSVDYSQNTIDLKEVWAAIQTSKGSEIFDGTNVIGVATHFFYIRKIDSVTFENFIEYNDKKYRILDAQNIDEDNSFMLLRCTERGDKSKNSNRL